MTVSPLEAAIPQTSKLLQVAEREGWAAALYYYNKEQVERGGNVLEDERIADWRYLLPSKIERTVLTLGCGWGTVPVALAEGSASVYAADSSADKIALLDIRRRQQGLNHLRPIHATHWADLQLPAASFDLVSVREFNWEGGMLTPFDVMLRRIDPLLKPGGIVQLTVANRLAFQYLLRLESKPNSSPLHSLAAYRRMLRAAGFSNIEVYAPLPHFDRIPMFYIPLDDSQAQRFFFSHLFPLFERVSTDVRQAYALQYAIARTSVRIALGLHLTRLAMNFVSGFCIFAKKAG